MQQNNNHYHHDCCTEMEIAAKTPKKFLLFSCIVIVELSCLLFRARHEFCASFTGIRLLGNEFYPPKNSKVRPFLLLIELITEEKCVYYFVSLISFNLHIKPPIYSPFTSNGPETITKNNMK